MYRARADLGGCLGGCSTPPKFYYEQARKLLEAVVQVKYINFIRTYIQLGNERWKEQGE